MPFQKFYRYASSYGPDAAGVREMVIRTSAWLVASGHSGEESFDSEMHYGPDNFISTCGSIANLKQEVVEMARIVAGSLSSVDEKINSPQKTPQHAQRSSPFD